MKHVVTLILTALFIVAGCGQSDPNKAEITPLKDAEKQGKAQPVISAATWNIASKRISPGGSVDGAITIFLAPGWHTYGDPPGDSGMPPTIRFNLPKGWQGSRLLLPPTKEFRDVVGVTYGYEDELIIPFRLTAPADAAEGNAVDVGIELEWLICNKTCIPKSDTFTTKITVEPTEKENNHDD